MLSETITKALNEQVELEGSSSQYYLAMASWAENNGLNGVSNFLYRQADEERQHMLKLIKYVNERGGIAIIPALSEPPREFETLMNVFEQVLKHEVNVTKKINDLVGICLNERDYTTQNFLQWYVAEQIEEEALAKMILDKLRLIGSDKGGLYLFDRDLSSMQGIPMPKTV
jgi:ferritin